MLKATSFSYRVSTKHTNRKNGKGRIQELGTPQNPPATMFLEK
jgi:hypothetical protein